MKIFEFASDQKVKMSPFINDKDVLVNYARAIVNADLVQVKQVPISKILFTQPLDADSHESVEEFNEYDSLPFAVLVDGYYHLLDGHHRLKEAMDNGNTRVLIFVADADDDEITEGSHKKRKHHNSTTPVVPFTGRWWYGGMYSGPVAPQSSDGDNDADDMSDVDYDAGLSGDMDAGE